MAKGERAANFQTRTKGRKQTACFKPPQKSQTEKTSRPTANHPTQSHTPNPIQTTPLRPTSQSSPPDKTKRDQAPETARVILLSKPIKQSDTINATTHRHAATQQRIKQAHPAQNHPSQSAESQTQKNQLQEKGQKTRSLKSTYIDHRKNPYQRNRRGRIQSINTKTPPQPIQPVRSNPIH